MAVNVASRDPPITLARRLELQETRISLRVMPHMMVFKPSLADVWSEQKLVAFVDGLLLKLSAELPAANSPTPGGWKLTRNGSEEDLSKWKPSTLDTKTPIFIISGVQDHLPLVRTTFAAQSETWAWARQTKSFILPLGAAFLLQSDTHILVSLLCQTRVKVFGKKKKIHESRHSVLIPIGYTVSDVLGLIRSSSICGIYQEPHEDNLRLDRRSVGELGWTNGTVLRLELW